MDASCSSRSAFDLDQRGRIAEKGPGVRLTRWWFFYDGDAGLFIWARGGRWENVSGAKRTHSLSGCPPYARVGYSRFNLINEMVKLFFI